MKPRVGRPSNLDATLRYCFGSDERRSPRYVCGNISTRSLRRMSWELRAIGRLRPEIKRKYWHCSLAIRRENLSKRQWAMVVRLFLELMGLDPAKHPYSCARHEDTSNDHVHIVVSRIAIDGTLWHGEWEAYRAIEACQTIERRFGLSITQGLKRKMASAAVQTIEGRHADHQSVISANRRASKKKSRIQDAKRLTELLKNVALHSDNLPSFIDELDQRGVEAVLSIDSNGLTRGMMVREHGAVEYLSVSAVSNGELCFRILAEWIERSCASNLDAEAGIRDQNPDVDEDADWVTASFEDADSRENWFAVDDEKSENERDLERDI